MLKKALVLLLFWGSVSQAKTLSEMVFDEQMREKNNYVFSNTSVDGLLSLISFGLTSSNQEKLVQYWDGITLKKKSQILSSLNEKTPGINILCKLPNLVGSKLLFFVITHLKML